jgi:glycosyltransferase involved in cell wall biosynthesis
MGDSGAEAQLAQVAVEQPLVSVLIAACNAERFIAQTLDSVLAQSWKPLEIIVVDDGSIDRTTQILAKYAPNPKVKVFRQENRGQCVARNRAARAASGRFIKFLDADDLLAEKAIELQVTGLCGAPDCVASADWARFFDDPAKPWFAPEPMWDDLDPVTWLVRAWMAGGGMTQCGVFLIPKAVLDRSGLWDERLTLIDDLEFFTRVLLSSKGVRFTRGATLYYRSGLPASVSTGRTRSALESGYRSLTLATDRLLATEDSPRTRVACATVIQDFVYRYYPAHEDLLKELELRVRELGSPSREPVGTPGFHLLRRFLGWRLARKVEQRAVRYGLNRSALQARYRRIRGEIMSDR